MSQKKTPALRFKGYSDEWEQRKLGEISNVITKGTTPKDKSWTGSVNYVKTESIDENSGNISLTTNTSIEEHEGYLKRSQLKEGDILFSIVGTLGRVGLVRTVDLPANTNQQIAIIRLKDEIINLFIFQFLRTSNVLNFIKSDATIGAQPSLSLWQINDLNINIPKELDEQQKIGVFFKQLDDTIALHQCKVDSLKQLKKALLQKMFPVKDKKVPELRFKRFLKEWEQRKFKDVLKSHSFRQYLAEPQNDGEFEIIQQGDKPIIGYTDGYPFIEYDDITLFGDHTVSLYKPTKPFFVATDGVKILSADGFDGRYLFSTLERYKPESQGYKRHFTILKNECVYFTKNSDEQNKIGTLFTNLDALITLNQSKLEKLKSLKQAYLQKMFI